jgi:hypothetical protein
MTQDLCGGSPRELPEKVLEVVGALDDREDERAVAGGGDGLVCLGGPIPRSVFRDSSLPRLRSE